MHNALTTMILHNSAGQETKTGTNKGGLKRLSDSVSGQPHPDVAVAWIIGAEIATEPDLAFLQGIAPGAASLGADTTIGWSLGIDAAIFGLIIPTVPIPAKFRHIASHVIYSQ